MRMFPAEWLPGPGGRVASLKGLMAVVEEVRRCGWEAVKCWGPGAEACLHLWYRGWCVLEKAGGGFVNSGHRG